MYLSVIAATYNRAGLLDNALEYYAKQTLPFDQWEYLICDDLSEDNTKEVVDKWIAEGLPLRYFTNDDLGRPKVPGEWRDGCKLRNSLSTFATGRVLVSTHPEIILPLDALEVMYEAVMAHQGDWVTAIPYWLPKDISNMKKWKTDLHSLREMSGFYDPSWPDSINTPGAPDYRNQNQEMRKTWESEVFWGMLMEKWRWMGGFREFDVWGSVDMDFLARRHGLGINTVFAKSPDSPHKEGILMVYHQQHESKRDMDLAIKALQEAPKYTSEMSIRQAGGLFSNYFSGPRERAIAGDITRVLGDHKARYRFAARFARGKEIMDIPCGTGYGAEFFRDEAFSYVGIDIDQESIDHGEKFHELAQGEFRQGDMRDIPAPDQSVDILVSYEGFEHITREDKQTFVDEMYRVIKPGGSFILSTPQKGAAKGTPWDIDILSVEELLNYFSDNSKWAKLDWFYQMSYGTDKEPLPGHPPRSAEVMILGGTRI